MDVFKRMHFTVSFYELAWSIISIYMYRLLSMNNNYVCALLENTIAYQYRLLSFYSTVEIHDIFVTRWDLSNTD